MGTHKKYSGYTSFDYLGVGLPRGDGGHDLLGQRLVPAHAHGLDRDVGVGLVELSDQLVQHVAQRAAHRVPELHCHNAGVRLAAFTASRFCASLTPPPLPRPPA